MTSPAVHHEEADEEWERDDESDGVLVGESGESLLVAEAVAPDEGTSDRRDQEEQGDDQCEHGGHGALETALETAIGVQIRLRAWPEGGRGGLNRGREVADEGRYDRGKPSGCV